MKINEIFFSIQGESTWAGNPTIFIRTSGCPLRCQYCDTEYAFYEGKKMSLEEIVSKVQSFLGDYVCITGGEPLVQPASIELTKQLLDLGYMVSVETSGTMPVDRLDTRAKKVIDVKTPDSKEEGKFLFSNLDFVSPTDEFKFVICSDEDFLWSKSFVKSYGLAEKNVVLFSPSHSQVSPQWLAEKILTSGLRVRLQLQQHKYIWGPEARGV